MSWEKSCIRWGIFCSCWSGFAPANSSERWHECPESGWFFGINAFWSKHQGQRWNQSSRHPNRQLRCSFAPSTPDLMTLRSRRDTESLSYQRVTRNINNDFFQIFKLVDSVDFGFPYLYFFPFLGFLLLIFVTLLRLVLSSRHNKFIKYLYTPL